MRLSVLYQISLDCQLATTDSRSRPERSLLITLKDESLNGDVFTGRALETGCAYTVIDEFECVIKDDQRYVLVDDRLRTLQQLANYHRRQLGTRVIGITGTNDKTTTKELVSAVFSRNHNILYTLGNLSNRADVPPTLLRLKIEHDPAATEMGANHPGEIKFLSEIAEPNCGIITNIGRTHPEGFGSFEGVVKTEGELYDFLRKKEGSTVSIHHDNAYLMNIAEGLNLIPYGAEGDLYANEQATGNSPYLAFEWKTDKGDKSYQVQTQLIEEYNFPDALAVTTIGHFFGVGDVRINKVPSGYTSQNNRSQLKEMDDNTLIVDAHNANPTSMMVALQSFRNMKVPHKVPILDDIRELGAKSVTEHQEIADHLKECVLEEVRLVGDQSAAAEHFFQAYPNVQEVIKELEANKPKGYTILIKGSDRIKLCSAVDHL